MTAGEPTFEVIAAAVAIAAAKLKCDLDQIEYVAARINLSPMGEALATMEIKKNLDALAHAHRFFKSNSPIEQELRAFGVNAQKTTEIIC